VTDLSEFKLTILNDSKPADHLATRGLKKSLASSKPLFPLLDIRNSNVSSATYPLAKG